MGPRLKVADAEVIDASDMIVMPGFIDTHRHIWDPIGVVVRGMDSSNVDSVFIAGKAKKRRGQLVDVDLARVRRLTYESRDYVVSKAGFTMPAI